MSVENIRYAHILDQLVASGASFACYFLPNSTEPTLVIEKSEPSELSSFDELDGKEGFVFAPFEVGNGSPLLLFQSSIIYNGFDVDVEQPLVAPFLTNEEPRTSTSEEDYTEVFGRFMEQLQEGGFAKLVLSRKLVVERQSGSVGEIFLNANKAYPSTFTYLVSSPRVGLWLGATPELLLRGEGRGFQTVALAGTMPFTSSTDKYVWGEKDREEQQLVADYISDRLERCGAKDINKVGPITVQAGNIVHLKTSFSFTVDPQVGVGKLVGTLHPTPAVCGLPKEAALRYIVATEKHQREYYSGFTGVIKENGGVELFVNLRCMKIEPRWLHLYAGGGITAKSEVGKEWMETSHKLRTLLSIIEAEEK